MPPVIIDTILQGSPEWLEVRLGKPGGTSFCDIVLRDGKRAAGRTKLLYRLASEILSGETTPGFQNAACLRGTELEPEARSAYELITGADVVQVGYVFADESRRWGCSPDGLVGDDGLVEIKCPLAHTHVEYMDRGKLPSKYWHQVHGQMAVTGRQWCDFLSFHPNIRPFLLRVERDEAVCRMITEALEEFCADLAELVERLR